MVIFQGLHFNVKVELKTPISYTRMDYSKVPNSVTLNSVKFIFILIYILKVTVYPLGKNS